MLLNYKHTEKLIRPQLAIPENLQPNGQDFPTLTPEILAGLKEFGWSRVGVVAAIVNLDGNILILENPPNDKIPSLQYGALSETSQRYGSHIEQPLETVARCMQEELKVDPGKITAYVPATNPYIVNQWPVGKWARW
jgi:hypothetical protein